MVNALRSVAPSKARRASAKLQNPSHLSALYAIVHRQLRDKRQCGGKRDILEHSLMRLSSFCLGSGAWDQGTLLRNAAVAAGAGAYPRELVPDRATLKLHFSLRSASG